MLSTTAFKSSTTPANVMQRPSCTARRAACAATGLSAGALYNHFPSKQALLAAVAALWESVATEWNEPREARCHVRLRQQWPLHRVLLEATQRLDDADLQPDDRCSGRYSS